MDPSQTVSPAYAKEFEGRLNALLAGVDRLPTLPQILWEIQTQLNSSENAASDLASAIQDDPSLTANVLRLANSAFYGFSGRFISVIDAVVAIGRREIERMVYATLAIESFGARDVRGSMDYAAFWTHSLQVAEAADFLAAHHIVSRPEASSEGYLGGLLHDIGKLILNQFLPADWAKVRAHAVEQACTDAEAEQAVLGMDHGEIGARLMEAWALPRSIIESTRWHHHPTKSDPEHAVFVQLVGSADSLCHANARGELGQKGTFHPLFKLEQRQLELLARALNNAAKRAALLLSMDANRLHS